MKDEFDKFEQRVLKYYPAHQNYPKMLWVDFKTRSGSVGGMVEVPADVNPQRLLKKCAHGFQIIRWQLYENPR